jgi:hypothetical protein
VYTDQRLNLSKLWEGPRNKCQGFKPDPGNPAVRDYRGASGNVSHGGNVHPSCNRKSRKRKPPTYSVARPISIPIEASETDFGYSSTPIICVSKLRAAVSI